MKKILSIVFVLVLATVAFVGCNGAPKQFSGEWKFSKISKVELLSNLDEDVMDFLKQDYGAEDEEGVVIGAFNRLVNEGTYENYYLKFEKKYTYTYDPIMEREATCVFYKTAENEGFISFYAELDAAEGNPDPINNPVVIYDAETDTMSVVVNYGSFMVTLELTR